MPFTVTFTATAFVAGSLRSSGNTLSVDDQTARMLVDLGVATAPGLTAQTGAVAPNLARTDGATFTGKITLPASTLTDGYFNLPHGSQPNTPVNGDLFTTTFDLGCRINGNTRYFAQKNNTNVYTAGVKQTVSHSGSIAGLNVGPAAGNPSSLANGDIWNNSTTNQLLVRINGGNQQINAVKAWVNFNGQGTIAIKASFNVTSLTDNAVGDYTVNFTTALADANYAVVGSGTEANDRTGIDVNLYAATTAYVPSTKTTSAARISVTRGGNVATDVADVSVLILR